MLRRIFTIISACGLAALSGSQRACAQAAKFVDVAAAKGVASFDSSPGDGHGPGAVFTDLNGDGWADIYMVKSFGGANGMFVNTPAAGGQRTFVRAANDAGAGDRGWASGAIAGDYDNDGDADLYVLNSDDADHSDPNDYFYDPSSPVNLATSTNVLYRNQLVETGQFGYVDVTAQTVPAGGANQLGLANAMHNGQMLNNSLTAAWADPDRDGDLDIYVGNHFEWFGSSADKAGATPGQRDVFYRNNGDGTFTDATMAVGVPGFETDAGNHSTQFSNGQPIQDFSSSNAVIFADFNNDQWPDLLVTNKVGGPTDRNMLYVNQGSDANGDWQGYKTATYTMPTATNPSAFGHRSGGAMGVDVGDLDNDGDLDFYITDWSNPDNYPSGGGNDYWINQLSETGVLNFVHSNRLPALFSWGTQLEDFDNNGWQDVHVTTDSNAADFLYLNSASGFAGNSAAEAGVAQIDNARGDQSADYNRDGLLDLLVINPWDGPTVLYENRSGEVAPGNHFLSLRLNGDHTLPGKFKSSRDAIGARVYVAADLDGNGAIDDIERMLREVVSGSSNAASTSSLEVEFGLGKATAAEIEIIWPSGRTQSLSLAADQFVTLSELLADFNSDGAVDSQDASVWQGGFGAIAGGSQATGDSDQDGDVDGGDFLNWQRSYGGASLGAVGAVAALAPEPGSALLVVIAAAIGRLLSRRRM